MMSESHLKVPVFGAGATIELACPWATPKSQKARAGLSVIDPGSYYNAPRPTRRWVYLHPLGKV